LPLPELIRRSAEKLLIEFCRTRTEGEAPATRVIYRVEEDHVTLFLEVSDKTANPPAEVTPIARLRFDQLLKQWTLHYPAEGNRWSFYLNVGPSLDLRKLLHHLDLDPLHIFWPSPR